MVQLTVCDICNRPKPCPFTATEENGDKFDICSVDCLKVHNKRYDN